MESDRSAIFEVFRTLSLRRSQRWAWRLVAANGRTIATSGEGYGSRAEAAERGWAIVTGRYDVATIEPMT